MMSSPAQILLPEPVPVFDGFPHALRGVEFIEQRSGQHELNVRTGKQRQVILHLDPGLEHEVHGHHRQGDVVAPGLVGSHLVLAVRRTVHTELLLDVLEGPLDEVALHLTAQGHLHIGLPVGLVAQAVLDLRAVDLTADQQPEGARGRFAAALGQPDSDQRGLPDQQAPGTPAVG